MAKEEKKQESKKDKSSKDSSRNKCPWGTSSKLPLGKAKNDPTWYYSDEVILKDAANFSYANMLGMSMKIADGSVPNKYFLDQVPGIMVLDYVPGVGQSDQTLTQASNMIYTFNRSHNSGSANYEAPDYTMYLLAHINAQAALIELSRIYGLINTYSRVNFFYPKAVVESLGFNYEELKLNIVDFRSYINNYILRLRALAFPNVIKLADKYRWMTQHIFKDSESSKSQIYAFKSEGWYKFTGTKYITGSALEFKQKPVSFNSLEEIRNYYDQFIDALLTDSDIAIMSGDTMKAYGDVQLEVPLLAENYITNISYELEALVMIQNAEVLSKYFFGFMPAHGGSSGDIIQLDGVIQYAPQFICDSKTGGTDTPVWWSTLTGSTYPKSHVITMPIDNPTAADSMVATRLMCNKDYTIAQGTDLGDVLICKPTSFGDSVIVAANMFIFDDTNSLLAIPLGPVVANELDTTTVEGSGMDALILSSKFDWCPKTMLIGSRGIGYIQDFQNFTHLSESDIAKAHAGALIGLLMPR